MTTLYAITFDCTDADRLARFWSGILGRAVDPGATHDFASIGLDDGAADGPHWMFISVPESKQSKNRVHVDLIATDTWAARVTSPDYSLNSLANGLFGSAPVTLNSGSHPNQVLIQRDRPTT